MRGTLRNFLILVYCFSLIAFSIGAEDEYDEDEYDGDDDVYDDVDNTVVPKQCDFVLAETLPNNVDTDLVVTSKTAQGSYTKCVSHNTPGVRQHPKSVVERATEEEVCITYTSGWWTYELCIGKRLTQYHVDDGREVDGTLPDVIDLGNYKSYKNEDDGFVEHYNKGMVCKEFGVRRSTTVVYGCSEVDSTFAIKSVSEPGSCAYQVLVGSSELCTSQRHPHRVTCAAYASTKLNQGWTDRITSTSQQRWVFERGIDYFGEDLSETSHVLSPNPEACARTCSNTAGCNYFTHIPIAWQAIKEADEHIGYRLHDTYMCYLKSSRQGRIECDPLKVPCVLYVSGYLVDYDGHQDLYGDGSSNNNNYKYNNNNNNDDDDDDNNNNNNNNADDADDDDAGGETNVDDDYSDVDDYYGGGVENVYANTDTLAPGQEWQGTYTCQGVQHFQMRIVAAVDIVEDAADVSKVTTTFQAIVTFQHSHPGHPHAPINGSYLAACRLRQWLNQVVIVPHHDTMYPSSFVALHFVFTLSADTKSLFGTTRGCRDGAARITHRPFPLLVEKCADPTCLPSCSKWDYALSKKGKVMSMRRKIECLEDLWRISGCSPRGGAAPSRSESQVSYWTQSKLSHVFADMKTFYRLALIHVGKHYSQRCFGLPPPNVNPANSGSIRTTLIAGPGPRDPSFEQSLNRLYISSKVGQLRHYADMALDQTLAISHNNLVNEVLANYELRPDYLHEKYVLDAGSSAHTQLAHKLGLLDYQYQVTIN